MTSTFETIPQKVTAIQFTGDNKQEILAFLKKDYVYIAKDGGILVDEGYDQAQKVMQDDYVVKFEYGYPQVYSSQEFKDSFREISE